MTDTPTPASPTPAPSTPAAPDPATGGTYVRHPDTGDLIRDDGASTQLQPTQPQPTPEP